MILLRRWFSRTLLASAGGVLLCGLALSSALPQRLQAQVELRLPVDSIAVEGISRVARTSVLAQLGFATGDTITYRDVQEAQTRLWRLGQFADIRVFARGGLADAPAVIVVQVQEQPLVRRVVFRGLERASPRAVRDSAGLRDGEPFSQQEVLEGRQALLDALADEGIPFARVQVRDEPVEGMENVVDVIFDVEEGNRVAVAEVVVEGNENVSDEDIVSALSTRPEGFWWFQGGGFDQEAFQSDLQTALPDLYRSRGFLDFEVLSDTLVLDPSSGKARVEIQVQEGPRYRVASLSIDGNREFEDEVLEQYFLPGRGGLLRSLGFGGDEEEQEAQGRIFDAVAFEEARASIGELYANRGFIFAQVNPVVEKGPPLEPGGDPTVSVGIEIDEGRLAFINRILIEGNDYTYERVILERITLLPGDVYSQAEIIRSYQSVSGLGFFETPMPVPDMNVDEETGEVDVTFEVVEKQTGAINFGTSVGGGVGLAGFIGYDQPNLFGQAKSGSVRWDFGRYLNNFTLTYSDPALFQSRISGTVSLFNARDRFFQFASGQRRRIGGSLRFGFPIPGWRFTRAIAGYAISRTRYQLFRGVDDTSLFGRPPGTQSQLSIGLARSTLNHPLFPTQGSRQTWTTEFNGGLLGGDGEFVKHSLEGTWWLPVGEVGGGSGGGRPITFALGTSLKGGAIFGDAGAFPFDRFWMGGVQFGQALRGYDETSITPLGYFPERSRGINDIDRLGDAFLSVTTEFAMRLNDNISLSTFFDAGNVWRGPNAINPSQLFRGAGVGLQLVTPFGPIGLDYAYGFDKAEPGWQLHFKMGPGF
ncbi:MAG: outer membrane protein assembly factor BamA [Gemmatimonadales bacterium]|nr:MAG: outer membrane protein assembly factor BamA [Gemmatimonadales bacterium]